MAKNLKLTIDITPKLDRRRVRGDARAVQDILDDIDIDIDVTMLQEAFEEAEQAAEEFAKELEGIEDASEDVAKQMLKILGIADDFSNLTLTPPDIPRIPAPIIERPKIPDIPDIPAPDIEPPIIPPPDISSIADAFDDVKAKLEKLRDQQTSALASLALEGKKGTAEWATLKAQLDETNASLGDIQEATEKISSGGFSLADAFFAGEALAGASEFLTGIEEKAAATRDAMKSVAAQTGLTGDALAALRVRADDAFRVGVGESVADAIKAVGTAQAVLGSFLSPDQIDAFVVKAAGIGKTFDKDVNEVINKSRTLIQNFKLSGEDAGNLIALGMQKAGGAMDDVLDTTDEYSQLMKEAGFSAEEFIGTLTTGVQAGSRDTDKLADAIKETQIRLKAGDITNSLKDIASPITETIEGIVAAAERGDITVKEMLQRTSKATEDAFDSGQISEAIRTKIQVAVSGTPAEDIGSGIYARIFSAPIDTEAIKAQAAEAGALMQQAVKPTVFQEVQRSLESFTSGAAEAFAPVISGAGGTLDAVGKVGPALALLQDKFKVFDVAGDLVKKLGPRILGLIPAIGAQTVATGSATGAQYGLNAAMTANPAGVLIVAIGALVAAFVIFGDTTKDIGEAVDDVNGKLADFEAAQTRATETSKATGGLKKLADEWDVLAGKPQRSIAEQKRFDEITAELAAKAPDYAEAVDVIGKSGEVVGQKFVIATDGVRAFAAETEALANEEAADQLEALQSEAAALVESYRESTENLTDMKRERAAIKVLQQGELGEVTAVHDKIADIVPLMETSKDKQQDLNKEISEESKKRAEAQATIKKAIDAAVKAGKSQKEIVESLGLSNEEAKKFGLSMDKSKGSVIAAAVATGGLQSAADRAKRSAEDLAAAYDKVKQAADSAYNNTFKAALALRQEERAFKRELGDLNKIPAETLQEEQRLRKAFLEQRLRDLPGEIKAEINAAREALKERRVFEAEEIRMKLSVGEIDFSTTDFRQQARDIRRQIGDILFSIANESEEDLVTQAISSIEQKLKTDKEKIVEQIGAIRKQVQQINNDNNPATVAVGDTELIKALEAQIIAIEKQADAEKLRAREEVRKKRLEEFARLLAEENKLLTNALSAEVEALNRQAEAIIGNEDAAIEERLHKRLQAIGIQQALSLKAFVSGNDKYLEKYGDLQIALREADKAATEEARAAALERSKVFQKELADLEAELLKSNAEAAAIIAKFRAEVDKATADATRIRADREIRDLQRRQDRELILLQRRNDMILRLAEDMAGFAEDTGADTLDAEFAARQAKLDKEKEQRLSAVEDSTEAQARIEAEFAARSEELLAQSEARKAELAARATGLRLEAERAAFVEELELQRAQLEEREKILRDSGRVEEANDVAQQIKDLSTEIDDNGSALLNLSGELQTNVTDIFNNLYAGNAEQVKSNFKKPFQALAGVLQQLATTKITEVLLGSIIGAGGIPGLLATILGRPFIASTINAILGPTLDSLLSFSTGGRVDSPTLAIIGDAARAGGMTNREWIFRDDQLRELISNVTLTQQRALVAELRELRAMLQASASRDFVLRGTDIVGSSVRTRSAQRRRVINPS